ncbi:MAG: nitroreductase [Clostridia bacterium]|nr:nitroreductase [Clostridia bacterium]
MGYIKNIIDEFKDNLEIYYDSIFKRKSFHTFDKILKITDEELSLIEEKYTKLFRLKSDIKTQIKIVPANETTSNVGAEYCILFFSEKKDNYLQNIGYLGQQLDLFLPSLNIGTLWCGMGKTDIKKHDGLDYVIMMCIAKVEENDFRKDMYSIPRKTLNQIWVGDKLKKYGDIARFAPSARNSQPWKVVEKDDKLLVYRDRQENAVSKERRDYMNNIDIGIFMCILDVVLRYNKINYVKGIYLDSTQNQNEGLVLNAIYTLK